MPDIQLRDYAVSAWQEGGEWHSHNIAFEDYSRMSTQQRKQSGERRLETPSWAVNDAEFRELLVNFLEERAYIKPWLRIGTLEERLKRAQNKIIERCAVLLATMDRLCADYVARKRAATTPEHRVWLRKQEQLIENLDTRLRFESKDGGAAMATGVVYHYYRVGLDSVGVGLQLNLKPPHVRQVIWRLHQTAKTLKKWQDDPSTRPVAPQRKPRTRKASAPLIQGAHIKASEANIRKHVARLEALIASGAEVPSRKWLCENGYRRSLRMLREFPSYFAHLDCKWSAYARIDADEAVRLRAEGLTFREIGKQFGCSATAVHQLMCRAGNHTSKQRAPRTPKQPRQPKPPVLCAECGKECPPSKRGRRKICSPECRKKWNNRRVRDWMREQRKRRRFCSDECRKAARKQKPAAAVNFTYQFS